MRGLEGKKEARGRGKSQVREIWRLKEGKKSQLREIKGHRGGKYLNERRKGGTKRGRISMRLGRREGV